MAETTVDRSVELVTDPAEALPPRPGRSATPPVLRWLLRRVAFICSLLLVGFVVYSGVEGLLQANSLDSRIIETRAEIVELQRDADQLAALVAWLDSDAYIERIAREDLAWSGPAKKRSAFTRPDGGNSKSAARPGGRTCFLKRPSSHVRGASNQGGVRCDAADRPTHP